MSVKENLFKIKEKLPEQVTLVAVSKTKPISLLQEAYDSGQRIFGENKIQEMAKKWEIMPKDIKWHMIGHVQRNKVKYMAAFVSLIHGVDSLKLLKEINKQAQKCNRVINCLLQMHIAQEDTKFGLNENELNTIIDSTDFKQLKNVKIIGLMGMATFTNNKKQISEEFGQLKKIYNKLQEKMEGISILSMGMSGDYKIAITEGSTMIRIGSNIFGSRN